MRIYREQFTGKDGQRRKAAKWYIDLADHNGIRRKFAGFTSKRQTESLLRNVEDLISCKLGGQQPQGDLQRWIDGLPENMLKRFMKWGLLDGQRVEGVKPLSKHIEDYEAVLKASGKSTIHISKTISRIKRVFNECGFVYLRDIVQSKVIKFLGELKEQGLTATTRNHHLTACKMFCNWTEQDGRASSNPLHTVRKERENRKLRGVLTREQFAGVVSHARISSAVYQGMRGPERAYLYLMAGCTGLRRKELIKLT